MRISHRKDISLRRLPRRFMNKVIKDEIAIDVVGRAELNIEKNSSPYFVKTKDIINYSIFINNIGNIAANNVIITDSIPDSFELVATSIKGDGINMGMGNQLTIYIDSIAPSGRATVNFDALVRRIPTSGFVENIASVGYLYTIDPSLPNNKVGSASSNSVKNIINEAIINNSENGFYKEVSSEYGEFGDILTYTLVLKNTGNASAGNVTILDTIANGVKFIENSINVNGINMLGANITPPSGINIGTINPNETKTITYNGVIDKIPNINSIKSQGMAVFSYTLDTSLPKCVMGFGFSNEVTTHVYEAIINGEGFVKSVEPIYPKLNEDITYKIVLSNLGNTIANNIVLMDSLADTVVFKEKSLEIDGTQYLEDLTKGISLGSLDVNSVKTIAYKVSVLTLPSINVVDNISTISFTYTNNPNTPNGKIESGVSNLARFYINEATIDENDFRSYCNKNYAITGDTLTYTLEISNSGNIEALEVVITNTIPSNTSFIEDSVEINGNKVLGVNLETGITINSIAPGNTEVITFNVRVETIPITTGYIENQGFLQYKYTRDPSIPMGEVNSVSSNIYKVFINEAIIDFNKGQSLILNSNKYGKIGSTIKYDLKLSNIGNTAATNVLLTSTIPNGTDFVENSVVVLGNTIPGANPERGVFIGVIAPSTIPINLSFLVVINTIPQINPIENSVTITFNYTVDPSIPDNFSSSGNSNLVQTQVNQGIINSETSFKKYVNKEISRIGDRITYSFEINNTGNVEVNNVIFYDTIPSVTSFVPNSFLYNSLEILNANPKVGVNFETLAMGITTLSFSVDIVTIPTINPISNNGYIEYTYTIDPSIPNSEKDTAITNYVYTDIKFNVMNSSNMVDKGSIGIGETLTFTIEAMNEGNIPCFDAVLYDTLPYGISLVKDSISINGNQLIGSILDNGLIINTLPVGTTTITFRAVVDTVPSPNPFVNGGEIYYKYNLAPSDSIIFEGVTNTNKVYSEVKYVFSMANNSVDKAYGMVGDTLTYTIEVENYGNTTINNALFVDTIPDGLLYKEGSFKVNGVVVPVVDPFIKVYLETLNIGVTTITFDVNVNTIPAINPAKNSGFINYYYTIDNLNPNDHEGSILIGEVETKINYCQIDLDKKVIEDNVTIGGTLSYEIEIVNNGIIEAIDSIIYDTLPYGVVFENNSLSLNGQSIQGEDITKGLLIGTIPIGVTSINFRAVVSTIPSAIISNKSELQYKFLVNPDNNRIENGYSESNEAKSNFNYADINGENFTQWINNSLEVYYGSLNEELSYVVRMKNSGTVGANNLIFKETLPNGLRFIDNSFSINGIIGPGLSPINPQGINLGTLFPEEVVTLTFKVTIDTVPVINPLTSFANVSFDYTVYSDKINEAHGVGRSNYSLVEVNQAFIDNKLGGITQSSDVDSYILGDKITYTFAFKNTGNIEAVNVMLKDTLPYGTIFEENSVIIDSKNMPGISPLPAFGINLLTLPVNETKTISFKVVVVTIPSNTTLVNKGDVVFQYSKSPLAPFGERGYGVSNSVSTTLKKAVIDYNDGRGFIAAEDKGFRTVGDTISYNLYLKNTGNINANNILVTDTIPEETTFIYDSIIVNGESRLGASILNGFGVTIPVLNPGATASISFNILVNSIPSFGYIKNKANVKFNYTIDPNNQNSVINTGESNVVITTINYALISEDSFIKSSESKYVTLGEVITYTLEISNKGNVRASNIIIKDTLPSYVRFLTDSVKIDTIPLQKVNPTTGIPINYIEPNASKVVTFNAVVNSLPASNPVFNEATCIYNYNVDLDGNDIREVVAHSTNSSIYIKAAVIDFNNGGAFNKQVSSRYGTLGETLTYMITLSNTGNIEANNVRLIDTLPNTLSFIQDSIYINDLNILGKTVEPPVGLDVGRIDINSTVTILFNAKIIGVPTVNPVVNNATVYFDFTADPSIPNGKTSGGNSNDSGFELNAATFSKDLGGCLLMPDRTVSPLTQDITYTINLTNKGNVTAFNTVFLSSISYGTIYIPGSVKINNTPYYQYDPTSNIGVILGDINPNEQNTIEFKVTVATLPTINPVQSEGRVLYQYHINPQEPLTYGEDISNIGETRIEAADMNPQSNGYALSADKRYVEVGGIATYITTLFNNGNMPAFDVILYNSIPDTASFVNGSVKIDGVPQPDSADYSIYVGQIVPNQTVRVEYSLKVMALPQDERLRFNNKLKYLYNTTEVIQSLRRFEIGGMAQQGQIISNTFSSGDITIQVVSGTVSLNLTPDKTFAGIGDVIKYTLVVKNTGNVLLENMILQNAIQNEIQFITNSLTLNSATIPGINPINQYSIGNLDIAKVATITYQVTVASIPVSNAVNTTANASFKYIVDPSLPLTSGTNSITSINTTIREAIISNGAGGFLITQSSSSATMNDIVTYTIIVKNTGNITANNVMLMDTIPSGLQYVEGSVKINGISDITNPISGIILGNIRANTINTINYSVRIAALSTNNAVFQNAAYITYDFKLDPAAAASIQRIDQTNIVALTYTEAQLEIKKTSSATSAIKDAIFDYTLSVKNIGNLLAENIVVFDTLPFYLELVDSAIYIDTVHRANVNLATGVTIPNLAPMAISTVTFGTRATILPPEGVANNLATATYSFRVSQTSPIARDSATSNIVKTLIVLPINTVKEIPIEYDCNCKKYEFIKPFGKNKYSVQGITSVSDMEEIGRSLRNHKMWKQYTLEAILNLDENAREIQCVTGEIEIIRKESIDTPNSNGLANYEGKVLTGIKKLVDILLTLTIQYQNIEGKNCAKKWCKIYAVDLTVASEYINIPLNAKGCIEDITITNYCDDKVSLVTTTLVYLEKASTYEDTICESPIVRGVIGISNSTISPDVRRFIYPGEMLWNESCINFTDRLNESIYQIVMVTANLRVTGSEIIANNLMAGVSTESLEITGKKLIVNLALDAVISYTTTENETKIRKLKCSVPATTYIILPSTANEKDSYNILGCIENLYVCSKKRIVFTNANIVVKAIKSNIEGLRKPKNNRLYY